MLTRIQINNFKRFDSVDIELGKTVVFIGPNNSGKTTALQALALWDIGLRKWGEKRKGKSSPEKRPGVTINKNDLISLPVPNAKLLWKNLHIRNVDRSKDKQDTQNIKIEIIVEGISKNNIQWACGLEFDYANEESFYCRPLHVLNGPNQKRMSIPDEAYSHKIAFLPPMSGLAAIEPKWEQGRINVLLGEGQTAQVLRNLCYQLHNSLNHEIWEELSNHIKNLFGISLIPPKYIIERGEITMSYQELDGTILDISCSGRGLQQTLLLLAFLYANKESILLLDEPDAHLEILRQRQIYELLTDVAQRNNSQIIAASHSEIILNEAAERDMVISFVGTPHRIDDKGSQVLKSLKEIGYDQYYQAGQTGWVLYLEGSTDYAILKAFAKTLGHEAYRIFEERPFVSYVSNKPQEARRHLGGLKEAKRNLYGIAIFDRLDKEALKQENDLTELMWKRNEIENYLCTEEVLIEFVKTDMDLTENDLFYKVEIEKREKREKAMRESIFEITNALSKLKRPEPWSPDCKVTDWFLEPLFDNYYNKLNLPNLLKKTNYHVLASLVPKDKIDPEVVEKLDAIVSISKKARPTE